MFDDEVIKPDIKRRRDLRQGAKGWHRIATLDLAKVANRKSGLRAKLLQGLAARLAPLAHQRADLRGFCPGQF